MRRFNRDTMLVATGLLGTVIFAALVLAVQEHHPLQQRSPKKAMQTTGEVLPNANPVELSEVAGLSGKSTDQISSEWVTSFDDGFTPDINHANLQANVSSRSPAQRHDLERAIRPTIAYVRHRSSTRLRFANVKIWFSRSGITVFSELKNRAAGDSSGTRTKSERRKSVTPPKRSIDASECANIVAIADLYSTNPC